MKPPPMVIPHPSDVRLSPVQLVAEAVKRLEASNKEVYTYENARAILKLNGALRYLEK